MKPPGLDEAAVPLESFEALQAMGVRHGFVGRVSGVDVLTDRATAISRLDAFHLDARRALAVDTLAFVTAEQVHGREVAILADGDDLPMRPLAGVDALVTNRADVCLGIYTADCCPVFLVDPVRRVIGLAHSGRKGTEARVTSAAVQAMGEGFGSRVRDVVVQLGPCIRPPWYEVDIAPQIVAECRSLGVARVEDCGACTAADPGKYYSYRREKGRTGRMVALLALA